jgi:hypothetical protein
MRNLTELEIARLEEQGCRADDWTRVVVDEDLFLTDRVRGVTFVGDVAIGGLTGSVEVEEGFVRPCGLRNVLLRNVSVAEDCLIENVSGYISNYDIGSGCYVSGVGMMTTLSAPSFGCGQVIPVLNEAGEGNVVLHERLTSQQAALMVEHPEVLHMVERELSRQARSDHGSVGERCRIVGVRELVDVRVGDGAELQGCSRLSDSTILSTDDAPTLVGPDVIMNGSVVAAGAVVTDGAKVSECFVGESCHVGRGFCAEHTLFFSNSWMDSGEACASFCGPFSTSHHKSTLLIGGQFSFYNAGSGTNQSNHAYKMGALHYGYLQRGSKTASGSHILWPADFGAFSMVMGKVQTHPRLCHLPFSYVIAMGEGTVVVPGISLRSAGTWRDVHKWPRRDMRPHSARRDLVNMAFPNPYIVQQVLEGKRFLENLLATNGGDVFQCDGYSIRRVAAVRGVEYYDMAIRLFVREVLNTSFEDEGEMGADEWLDLGGMLAPRREIQRLVDDVAGGSVDTIDELELVLQQIHESYGPSAAAYARMLYQQLGGSIFFDQDYWLREAEDAYERWKHMVRLDAEREYDLGDVDEATLRDFIDKVE